ncbi:MAG: transcriptional regulator [Bryobacteraceae bacterium]
MSTGLIELDPKRYGRLLAKALPAVVRSEDENDRMLAIVESLMAKGEENLSAEENALLDLLVDLMHDFEERHDPFPSSPPHRMVAFLLEQRGLSSSALCPVLGTKSRVFGGPVRKTGDQQSAGQETRRILPRRR